MRFLFSDRFAPVGLLLALGCFTVAAMTIGPTVASRFIDARAALAEPERFHGRPVFLECFHVTAPGVVEKKGMRFRVEGLPAGMIGDHVSLIGRFDRGGFIVYEKAEFSSDLHMRRGIMYATSLLVLAALLVAASRRFRWRLPEGLFEARNG